MPWGTIIFTSFIFIICVITPFICAEILIKKGGSDDGV